MRSPNWHSATPLLNADKCEKDSFAGCLSSIFQEFYLQKPESDR